jgi:Domain of unknown function (DUF4383)
MIKTLGIIFAVVFILIGILGFIPPLVPNGKLLGIFEVDAIHNSVHLLSGIIAGAAVISGNIKMVRLYFQVFGIVYAIVAILGFALSGNLMLMMMNTADNILHTVIAAASLVIGFVLKE